jgi:hypothetical protein
MLNESAAVATVAVALFALVELWNGRHARQARTKTANVRISAIPYALRRQLRSWLQPGKGKTQDQSLARVQQHFPTAEARMADLLTLAADPSPHLQEYLREAYVRFYRGTQTINEQLDQTGGLTKGYTLDLSQWPRFEEDFTACIALLDRVVEPALENADSRLAALWKQTR